MSVITEMYREMGIRNSVVNLGKEIEATLKKDLMQLMRLQNTTS